VNKGQWTIFSNHGRILIYLASNPKCTIQVIAQETGLSIAAVNNIVRTLEKDGYISRIKVGRRNSYHIHPEKPLRHQLEQKYTLNDLLVAFDESSIVKVG
jgi:DNA-binding Lrp family transcriptional regulator